MTSLQRSSLPDFFRARLSPDGVLGLHLTLGVLTLLLAAFVFGHIAEDVMSASPLVALDLKISNWLHAHAVPAVTGFFLFITGLHSTAGVLLLALFFALLLVRRKAWDWVVLVVLTVPLGMGINVLLKQAFQRARPTFENPLLTLTTYSFPSGHTAAATLLYGVVGGYCMAGTRGWRRLLTALLALLMVALVGLSRIYLGVHFLSDVLAAVASSTVWMAITFTAVATWRKRQASLLLRP